METAFLRTPEYHVCLHEAYYNNGYFNLGLTVNRFVSPKNMRITLILADSGISIPANLERSTNHNKTPRVDGGELLRVWFFRYFQLNDEIVISIISPTTLRIDRHSGPS